MKHATEADRPTRAHQGMTAVLGIFSCALGISVVIQIGYLRQLLAV